MAEITELEKGGTIAAFSSKENHCLYFTLRRGSARGHRCRLSRGGGVCGTSSVWGGNISTGAMPRKANLREKIKRSVPEHGGHAERLIQLGQDRLYFLAR